MSVRLIELSHRKLSGGGVKSEKFTPIGIGDFIVRILLHDVINFVAAEVTSLPAIIRDFLEPGRQINREIGDFMRVGIENQSWFLVNLPEMSDQGVDGVGNNGAHFG